MRAPVPIPHADIPVRGRIALQAATAAPPDLPDHRTLTEAALTTLLLAAVLTGGTVLVREPLPLLLPAVRAVGHLIACTGAYVVASRTGLTATSRASGGALDPLHCRLESAVLPILAVAAARAEGPSTLVPVYADAAWQADRCARLGLRATVSGDRVEIAPGFAATPGVIDHGGEPPLVLAALLLGLVRPGTSIVDAAPLARRLPGFTDSWSALLAADEFLLPGSDLVPTDYVRRGGESPSPCRARPSEGSCEA